ncbi:hypothetical protein K7X08_035460 [Anisodus acutangulus]|uniref:Uncharacterized protein n=1 Tax=Anisodus acutangulus TaxID=402998 RepID=A0A9Q1R1V8_9SOLA|nr:hypothetical protein K7X08_035460 [Anisodus acutangulus]
MSVKSCVTKSGYGNGFLVEESDDDERIHTVTATKTGGNKRSREPEDVNWDKRRRLKMYFYLAAEGLYLSCIKDPNNVLRGMNVKTAFPTGELEEENQSWFSGLLGFFLNFHLGP